MRPGVSPDVAELTIEKIVGDVVSRWFQDFLCSITLQYVLCERYPLELSNLRSPVWA